jgi:putative ABC transport system substrate-binding protein
VINEIHEKPVVFGAVTNPYVIGAGAAADTHLANVTGVPAAPPILESMQVVQKSVPGVKRLGIIWNTALINSHAEMIGARAAAAALKLEIVEVNVGASTDVLAAAQQLASRDIDVFYIIYDYTVVEAVDAVFTVADEQDIPVFSTFTDLARRGAAAAVGCDYVHNGYLASQVAIRVMEGEDPATIRFADSLETSMVANVAAAERQGFTLPQEILDAAVEVIE